ncbi:3'-5' RNA helicase YTHDC2-like [Onthophagus taurus]|uniref:3'-5' RNA helicase YTHDC2-like n=1 Tax=Onthophagus taurus TaxID=166361 RepID=UPI0039BE011F
MFKNVTSNQGTFEFKTGNDAKSKLKHFVMNNCNGPTATFNDLHQVVITNGSEGNLCFGDPPFVNGPSSYEFADFRSNLPVFEMRNFILETIERNCVTIISGETGSGKTTQIPQYLLEYSNSLNKPCRIICTQPRRISTVAVAERVSIERGERVGETCGYQIKLDCCLGPTTSLIYCTTGVLLRTLMSGFAVLKNVSYIIIDEIHERDKFTDFVLISLRECIKQFPNLRLILMSATLDVELFENYFGNVAKVEVKGRTYPIQHYFLENILLELNYESEQMKLIQKKNSKQNNEIAESNKINEVVVVDQDVLREMDEALLHYISIPNEENFIQVLHLILSEEVSVNHQHSGAGYTLLMAAAANGHIEFVEKLLNLGADVSLKSQQNCTAIDMAEQNCHNGVVTLIRYFEYMKRQVHNDVLSLYNQTILEDIIDHDLIVAIITHIHQTEIKNNMGVLVFLPGYEDIMLQLEALSASPVGKFLKICVLHGSMMVNAQHDVFKRSQQRKVILSTNVAETSITIDDIAHVIDTGKVKQKSYDSLNGTSTLETTWISIASLKQRAGRAGRCAPGKCYHIFSRTRYESLLINTIPEILTVPLHELCLQTKQLAPHGMKIADFLSKALEAPNTHVIVNAINDLVSLGALDSNESLTVLGSHLLRLCIEPHLGKMLIYSVIFKCLDPVLTVVATLTHKDPFVLPTKGSEKVEALKRKKSLTCGTFSDHMALLMVYQKWQEAKLTKTERKFYREYYVSPSCMDMISATRCHLVSLLRQSGLVPVSSGIRNLVQFNRSWPIVKAALCAGLYPNVVFSHHNKVVSRNEKRVLMHSTSCLRGTMEYSSGLWFVFDEMSKLGNLCNLKGVTAVTPLTIVLTAGSTLRFDPESSIMEIDDSLNVNLGGDVVWKFRLALNDMIQRHVTQPSAKTTKFETDLLGLFNYVLVIEESYFNLVQPFEFGKRPRLPPGSNGYLHFNTNGESSNDFDPNMEPNFGDNVERNQQVLKRNFNGIPNDADDNHDHQSGSSKQYQPCLKTGSSKRQGCGPHSKQPELSHTSGNGANVPSTSQDGVFSDHRRFGIPTNVLIDMTATIGPVYRFGPSSIFYVIRPLELSNIMISLSQGIWNFAPQTERKVFRSFLENQKTFLLYNVLGTSEFQALAQLMSTNDGQYNTPAKINWLSTQGVTYDQIRGFFPNGINYFVDGYQISREIGIKIATLMMERNDQPNVFARSILFRGLDI